MVYGEHPVDYEASAQVFVMGDRGLMHSITGSRFYEHWRTPGAVDELLARCGVKTLEGYCTHAHARLMSHALRHVAKVTVTGRGEMAGLPMVWIVVESKQCALSSISSHSLSSPR